MDLSFLNGFDALEDRASSISHRPQSESQLLAILVTILHVFVYFGNGLCIDCLQTLLASLTSAVSRMMIELLEIIVVDFHLG